MTINASAPSASALAPLKKDATFFVKSGVCGGLAASFTHVILVPVDVVKTRMQLAPSVYTTFSSTAASLVRAEGPSSLLLGLGPTNYGYLTQGFFKYGLYEYFKVTYAKALGQEKAERNATALYLASGMTAELIADVALTPLEAVRIRIVSNSAFANGTLDALRKVVKQEGFGGLYKGFIPLVLKQVPYTAVKFAVFEATEDVVYEHVMPRPRHELSSSTQLGVTLFSGFVGGVVSAVASHPADTLLTRVSVSKGGILSSLAGAARSVGFAGLWAGLLPRMGMVGILAGLQLLVYDAAKVTLFGLPTSQGIRTQHHQSKSQEQQSH